MSTATAPAPAAKKAAVIKTYILLDIMDSTAPIYQTIGNGQRVQIKKIPYHRPYLQVTFQDAEGISKTIRYKESLNTIDQQEQIDKYKVDANAKFTDSERDSLYFRFGILTTNKKNLQDFLEAHPEFDKFDGTCDQVKKRCFKLLDKTAETKIKNDDIKLRVQAGSKIFGLDLAGARELLISLNGSYFETPNTGNEEDDLKTCQNMLMEFMDDTNDEGVQAILKDRAKDTVDEQTTILLGKLLNIGGISFDDIPNAVAKKGKDDKWMKLRDISSSEYTPDQRLLLFSDFLNTDDGKPMKTDLEKLLVDLEKKKPDSKT